MNWQYHIVSDREVLLGKPVIKGTRISIELILELLASGWTEQMILDSYLRLTQIDFKAVYAYLQNCMQQELYLSFH